MMAAAKVAGWLPAVQGLRLEESLGQFAAPLREQVGRVLAGRRGWGVCVGGGGRSFRIYWSISWGGSAFIIARGLSACKPRGPTLPPLWHNDAALLVIFSLAIGKGKFHRTPELACPPLLHSSIHPPTHPPTHSPTHPPTPPPLLAPPTHSPNTPPRRSTSFARRITSTPSTSTSGGRGASHFPCPSIPLPPAGCWWRASRRGNSSRDTWPGECGVKGVGG
jgi:hypothetical protein